MTRTDRTIGVFVIGFMLGFEVALLVIALGGWVQ